MTGERVLAYCCAAAVAWVKDADQTIVVEEETGRCWSMRGVEAAIWDLLTLDYSFEQIVRFLSALLNRSSEETTEALSTTMQRWEEAGILCAVRENGLD